MSERKYPELTVQQDFEDKVALDKHILEGTILIDQIDELAEKLDKHKDAVKAIFERRYHQDGKIIHERPDGSYAKYIVKTERDYPVQECMEVTPRSLWDDLFPRGANKTAIRELFKTDAELGKKLEKLSKKSDKPSLEMQTARQKARKKANDKAKREAAKAKKQEAA